MPDVRIITVNNTSLPRVAAQELGDAREWIRIAQLNNMKNPIISGTRKLKIPSKADKASLGNPD